MSFELRQSKHIECELTTIARRELRRTSRVLTEVTRDSFDHAVHESRKSIKKVRAIAAFLEQAGGTLPRKDRKRVKAAGRTLSRLRDSAAIIETFDRVRRRHPKQLSEHTYGILRGELVRARDREHKRAERDGAMVEAAKRLVKTRKSARQWTVPTIDVSKLGAPLAASYRRNRIAMQRAEATKQSATLHRWRKELKVLWYQLRLTQPLTTGVAPLVADLERLETALGDDHDLVVLVATLRGCRRLRTMHAHIRRMDRLAARMRALLRRRAFALGHRLNVREPEAFEHWIRRALSADRDMKGA